LANRQKILQLSEFHRDTSPKFFVVETALSTTIAYSIPNCWEKFNSKLKFFVSMFVTIEIVLPVCNFSKKVFCYFAKC
ncbi:MAG: hypothetical protein IJE92_04920, partial [Clostridia bacterium]|nr:hypothetical protein [Clostridia bacterium]